MNAFSNVVALPHYVGSKAVKAPCVFWVGGIREP
jgi:hypothetical protein